MRDAPRRAAPRGTAAARRRRSRSRLRRPPLEPSPPPSSFLNLHSIPLGPPGCADALAAVRGGSAVAAAGRGGAWLWRGGGDAVRVAPPSPDAGFRMELWVGADWWEDEAESALALEAATPGRAAARLAVAWRPGAGATIRGQGPWDIIESLPRPHRGSHLVGAAPASSSGLAAATRAGAALLAAGRPTRPIASAPPGTAPGLVALWAAGEGGESVVVASFAAASRALARGARDADAPLADATAALGIDPGEPTVAFGAAGGGEAAHATRARVRLVPLARAAAPKGACPPPLDPGLDWTPPPGACIGAASAGPGGVLVSTTAGKGVTLLVRAAGDGRPARLLPVAVVAMDAEVSCLASLGGGEGGGSGCGDCWLALAGTYAPDARLLLVRRLPGGGAALTHVATLRPPPPPPGGDSGADVPESVSLLPPPPGAAGAAHAVVGWRSGALTVAVAAVDAGGGWALEPARVARVGGLPLVLRPAPPGCGAHVLALGERAALVTLPGAPGRAASVERVDLGTARAAVALPGGGAGCPPCLLVASPDGSLAVLAIEGAPGDRLRVVAPGGGGATAAAALVPARAVVAASPGRLAALDAATGDLLAEIDLPPGFTPTAAAEWPPGPPPASARAAADGLRAVLAPPPPGVAPRGADGGVSEPRCDCMVTVALAGGGGGAVATFALARGGDRAWRLHPVSTLATPDAATCLAPLPGGGLAAGVGRRLVVLAARRDEGGGDGGARARRPRLAVDRAGWRPLRQPALHMAVAVGGDGRPVLAAADGDDGPTLAAGAGDGAVAPCAGAPGRPLATAACPMAWPPGAPPPDAPEPPARGGAARAPGAWGALAGGADGGLTAFAPPPPAPGPERNLVPAAVGDAGDGVVAVCEGGGGWLAATAGGGVVGVVPLAPPLHSALVAITASLAAGPYAPLGADPAAAAAPPPSPPSPPSSSLAAFPTPSPPRTPRGSRAPPPPPLGPATMVDGDALAEWLALAPAHRAAALGGCPAAAAAAADAVTAALALFED